MHVGYELKWDNANRIVVLEKVFFMILNDFSLIVVLINNEIYFVMININ